MTDEITGATNQLALFGKTFSQMRMDWDKGFRLSAFTKILPKVEVTTLKNLSIALKDNTVTAELFNDVLSHTSTQAQIMGSHIIKLKAQLDAGKITTEEYDVAVQKMISSQSSASITSQLLSTAMRTIVNVGVGIAISGLITLFQKLVNAEKESIQATQDAAKESNSYIKSLDDLKSEYNDIINSTKTASEKTQDLRKWKSELIQLYKDEKEAIEDVNLNRETGIALLETEIRRTRDLWLGENQGNIEKAVRAIENSQYSDLHFIIDNDEIFSDGIRKEILELFDSYNQDTDEFKDFLTGLFNGYSEQTAEFKFDTDNIYDTKKRLEDVIALFGSFTDELSPNERELLAQLNNYKDKIDEVIQTHGTTYQTYKEYLAQNSADDLFDDYIKQQGKNIASVTEETFNSWKEGLIALAGESEPIRKALQEIIDNTFPQYAEKEEETTNKSNGLGDAVTSLSERITELDKSLDDIYESFDTAFSNQSTIQSAFDKIQSGTDLTASEMRGLIKLCKKEFPEIGTLFTKTAKGYTISADNLIKANGAIMNSAKETVQSQINGYQDVIDKYNEIKNIVSMPESARQDRLKALGLTEDDIKNAEQQINQYRLILGMLGITLEKTTEEVSKYNQIIKDNSSKVSLIASATKEMTDEGHISASTYAELVEKGGNFTECLEVQNGKLVLNIDKLKELEKQEYLNIIAENNLAIKKLETTERTSSNAKAVWEEIQAYKTENALLQQMANEIDDAGVEEPSKDTSDPIKEAFEKEMKDIEHLHNMGLASDEEYYDALEKANEKHYKNSVDHESDYFSNVEKIYKARQSLYKDDADKQFDALEEDFETGRITANEYVKALKTLSQALYGEGSLYDGTEFAKKELESLDKTIKEVGDDIYSEFVEKLSADGDLSLDNVLKDAEKLSKKNVKLFSDDPKTFKKNAEDIFSAVADSAKDALDKMLISPERYLEIIDEWGKKLEQTKGVISKAKELSESDYLDAWDLENGFDSKNSEKNFSLREKRVEYMFKLADKLYGKNGQRDIKAWNELVKQALEEQKSILEDQLDLEKEYWEDRKDAKIKEFEEEIKRLESIQDEEEKINKAEELRLNLIKARNNLEQAKNNRNQLVFHNGTFEYMADQEAVMSAQEEMAEAVKEIKDNELQQQIDILKEQKDNAEEFYDKIIEKIDGYLDDVSGELSSNSDVLDIVFGKDNKVIQTADELEKSNIWENMGEWNLENIIKALGGKPTVANMANFMLDFASNLVGKQIMPTSLPGGTTNNSNNVTNNATKVINLGGISVKLELAVQSLDDFVNNKIDTAMTKLGNAIEQEMPKILAKA